MGVPWIEPCFANLEPAPGEQAHGVLMEMTPEEWEALIAHEDGYVVGSFEACTTGESGLACVSLTIGPKEHGEERAPSARYACRLAEGARLHQLPSEVIHRYEHLAKTGSKLSTGLQVFVGPVGALVPYVGLPMAIGLVALALLSLMAGLGVMLVVGVLQVIG